MFKYILCVLIVVLVFIVVHISINKFSSKPENFQGHKFDAEVGLQTPHDHFSNWLGNRDYLVPNGGTPDPSSGSGVGPTGPVDYNVRPKFTDDYVLKTDIERAARASTQKYCPVGTDYNPADFIKKSEIDFATACPQMPDLKDYVLKSTIPPVQKCPSCVCPKVKVSAGMCKKCPEPKNNCPKCQPCGVEQCKDVIQCAPGDQPVSCPKCPAPQPCPEPPEKVCPAFELPISDIECPAPKPCAMPEPCPDGEGRCPKKPDSKCKYYGIKEVAKERPVNDIVNELLLSDDPKLKELLESLKYKLNLNLSPSPTEKLMTEPVLATTQALRIPTTPSSVPSTSATPAPIPAPAPSTSSTQKEFKPESHNNSNEQYEFNSYKYSTLNNLNSLSDPLAVFNSNLANTSLDNASNLGCDVNGTNCSYNTNLQI